MIDIELFILKIRETNKLAWLGFGVIRKRRQFLFDK